MRIWLISHLFPTPHDEFSGICNLSRMKTLRELGHEILIIKPVSYLPPVKYLFPKVKFDKIKEYYRKYGKHFRNCEYQGFEIKIVKWLPVPAKFLWWQQVYTLHLCLKGFIAQKINDFTPDLIITAGVHPEGTYSRYLKNITSVPVVTIAEGSEILVYPGMYPGIDRIVYAINKYSDGIIFVSDYMQHQLTSKYHFEKWHTIKNGFEKKYFSCKNKYSGRAISRIISVGSLDYYKGHDILLSAMRLLDGFELTLIGDGPRLSDYEKYILDNQLSDRVKIIKYVDQKEMNKILIENDLFCLPSRSESFGVAAIEALASGLPVVASKTGEMPTVIKKGINGYLIEDLTPEGIVEAVNLARHNSWNPAAIAESVRNYGWDNWALEFERIIKTKTGMQNA